MHATSFGTGPFSPAMANGKTITTAIVGSHFHPPAKALLSIAPSGAALRIVPEPQNPYDANALRVEIASKTFQDAESLEFAVSGFGSSAEEVLAVEWWHLGYIPRVEAAQLCERIRLQPGLVEGVLGFAATGKPTITFTLEGGE